MWVLELCMSVLIALISLLNLAADFLLEEDRSIWDFIDMRGGLKSYSTEGVLCGGTHTLAPEANAGGREEVRVLGRARIKDLDLSPRAKKLWSSQLNLILSEVPKLATLGHIPSLLRPLLIPHLLSRSGFRSVPNSKSQQCYSSELACVLFPETCMFEVDMFVVFCPFVWCALSPLPGRSEPNIPGLAISDLGAKAGSEGLKRRDCSQRTTRLFSAGCTAQRFETAPHSSLLNSLNRLHLPACKQACRYGFRCVTVRSVWMDLLVLFLLNCGILPEEAECCFH